jgi:hypothetical protein
MLEYYYDINEFTWSKEKNTFYQEAWNLFADDYQHAFPSGRGQFFIKNYETGGFRRFRLIGETDIDLIFESEDGIRCNICINPDALCIYEYEAESN